MSKIEKMDQKTFRRHRKISKNHIKHCWKCGLPEKGGCRHPGCNEVQHCACEMIKNE